MTRSQALPNGLPSVFLVSDAMAMGVRRGRLRGSDLARPFQGVRARTYDASDVASRCRALLPRLPSGAVFSHSTAALLMGAPLPLALERDPRLHISTIDFERPPQLSGVVSHQIGTRGGSLRTIGRLPLTSPVLTWCLLASSLSVPDLVAVADFLVTGTHPLATLAQLDAGVRASAGQRGVVRLVRALPLVRPGPLSRPESHARLLYVAAGLPEPAINLNLYDAHGMFVAMVDLAWPARRVANEYEGKHHQERGQFRWDILRRERIEDLHWRLSRFTSDDIRLRPAETVGRMADRLGVVISERGVAAAVALSQRIAQ